MHLLHLISSIIVFGIVMLSMQKYTHTGLKTFWAMLAAVDIVVCTFTLYRTFLRSSTPDLSIPMFILSSLWFTALVLSAVEYAQSMCGVFGHGVWESCPTKRAHMAFEAIAFLLSFGTMVMEFGRWMVRRIRNWRGKKGDVEVIDGSEKGVGSAVVTPRTSFTAV